MSDYQRSQVDLLVERLDEPVERIFTIFGPRQCGKTTIVRQALAKIPYPSRYEAVDQPERPPTEPVWSAAPEPRAAAAPRDAEWLIRVWRECAEDAARFGSKFVLVLDEIQKIPRWSETVKGLWDADRASGTPLHVVVLGSAPMRMQADLTESLAGRFESIRATHWSFDEMRDAFEFDCEEFVFFGGYPGAAHLRNSFGHWREGFTDRAALGTRHSWPGQGRQAGAVAAIAGVGVPVLGSRTFLQEDARAAGRCGP